MKKNYAWLSESSLGKGCNLVTVLASRDIDTKLEYGSCVVFLFYHDKSIDFSQVKDRTNILRSTLLWYCSMKVNGLYLGIDYYFLLQERDIHTIVITKVCTHFAEIFLFLKKVKKSLRTHICAHTRRPAEAAFLFLVFLSLSSPFLSTFTLPFDL